MLKQLVQQCPVSRERFARARWRYALLLLSFALVPSLHPLSAQTREASTIYSAGAIYTFNRSTATIQAFEGSDACGLFTTGRAERPSFFVQSELPLLGDWLSVAPRISFRDLTTTFETRPTNAVRGYRSSDGTLVEIDRVRSYDASLGLLSIAPLLDVRFLSRFHVGVGPSFGVLTNKSFNETEHIQSPADAVYAAPNAPLSTRTIRQGSIDANTFQSALDTKLGLDIPLRGGMIIRPTILASIPLTSVSKSATEKWKLFSYGAGVEVAYDQGWLPSVAPAPEPPVAVQTQVATQPPTIAEGQPSRVVPDSHVEPSRDQNDAAAVLQVSIKAVGLNDDGTEVEEPVLAVERMRVTEVHPLLNYVFFDDGASAIPSRYHVIAPGQNKTFDERSLYTETALTIQHDVLNVIGKRLQSQPRASVTLTGCYSERSEKDSILGQPVALGRAKSVADYLESVWGIAPSRIRMKARALPEIASDERTAFGQAENRRVEILCSTPEIVAPLRAHRIERIATPPNIGFYPYIVSSAGVKRATITIKQRGRILQTLDANDTTGGAAGEHLWSLDESSMPDENDSLTYVFEVDDAQGNHREAQGSIRLKQTVLEQTEHRRDTVHNRAIERFSLLLFDYNSSQVTKRQVDNLMGEIAEAVDPKARVTLTGHTDQAGDQAYNERLASERVSRAAQMLAQSLKKSGKSAPDMSVESHGSRDVLFDNSLPEGRLLSRTVRVTVEHNLK